MPYAESTPPERGKGRLVAVLAVLLLLTLGGAGAFWYLGRDGSTPAGGTGAPASPATDPTGQASEAAAPVATTPAPASSTDPRFVTAGQCVRNEGAADKPKLAITECGAKTYQVLRRIDGETSGRKDAEAKCAKVDGYTDWYFFDSKLDALDFVLCLKRR
ncbi:LppU/SCO3897 family protein [Micromonospora viridifaciens]|uniref:LppU/SCO3897 family protein n=1 Tax=Micromonospora viridifaciens TaxID=1881 RepID=UPI0038B2AD0D